MNIYVDIDNVICESGGKNHDGPEDYSYENARPIHETIKRVNTLYDRGHTITYWTARGTETGINWKPLTTKQLDTWGCKYHKLVMGKPAFDIFIDDKAFNVKDFTDNFASDLNSQMDEKKS